jgi:hypothetical protein
VPSLLRRDRLAPLMGRWCSMRCPEVALWWDNDVDQAGRPIRPDVRASACKIWCCACNQARSLVSDDSQAADLMEKTVAQVSRYLDHRGVLAFSRKIDGLLMFAFRRSLYRRMTKFRRLQTLNGYRRSSQCDTRATRAGCGLVYETQPSSIDRGLSCR